MSAKKIGVVIGGSGLIGGTIVNYYKTQHSETTLEQGALGSVA